MNTYKLFTKAYGLLYNRACVPTFFLSPIRRILRYAARKRLPKYLYDNSKDYVNRPEHEDVVVSLTSFPGRIQDVWLTVSCLLCQSVLPHKIILYLSIDQFPDMKIPETLRRLLCERFDVRFVDGDIRSHKKYYYAFQEFPNKLIITVDDDLFYAYDLVESLYLNHQKYPNDVLCRYGKIVQHSDLGEIKPYSQWLNNYCINNKNFFFGSGGGTLFDPKKIHNDVLNKVLFQKLAPLADDVWLNAMVHLSNLHIRVITKELYLPIGLDDAGSLQSQNVGNNMNDRQIKDVREYYIGTYSVDPFSIKNLSK